MRLCLLLCLLVPAALGAHNEEICQDPSGYDRSCDELVERKLLATGDVDFRVLECSSMSAEISELLEFVCASCCSHSKSKCADSRGGLSSSNRTHDHDHAAAQGIIPVGSSVFSLIATASAVTLGISFCCVFGTRTRVNQTALYVVFLGLGLGWLFFIDIYIVPRMVRTVEQVAIIACSLTGAFLGFILGVAVFHVLLSPALDRCTIMFRKSTPSPAPTPKGESPRSITISGKHGPPADKILITIDQPVRPTGVQRSPPHGESTTIVDASVTNSALATVTSGAGAPMMRSPPLTILRPRISDAPSDSSGNGRNINDTQSLLRFNRYSSSACRGSSVDE